MHKKNRLVNELVPADDLYWDEASKKHTVTSREEEEKLFKACLNCRLDDNETLSVFRHFERYKTYAVLFKHFLEGNIGIYSFTEKGSPIFESFKKEEDQYLDFVFYNREEDLDYNTKQLIEDTKSFRGRVLGCSHGIDLVPFDRIFETVLDWCEKRGFSLVDGQNPDDYNTWPVQPISEDIIEDIKKRTWKISLLSASREDGFIRIRLELGAWFDFEE